MVIEVWIGTYEDLPHGCDRICVTGGRWGSHRWRLHMRYKALIRIHMDGEWVREEYQVSGPYCTWGHDDGV